MPEHHLIECKTQDAFKMAKEALVDYTGKKIVLNNYDGTSDFSLRAHQNMQPHSERKDSQS